MSDGSVSTVSMALTTVPVFVLRLERQHAKHFLYGSLFIPPFGFSMRGEKCVPQSGHGIVFETCWEEEWDWADDEGEEEEGALFVESHVGCLPRLYEDMVDTDVSGVALQAISRLSMRATTSLVFLS